MKRLRSLLLAALLGFILSIPAAPLHAAPPKMTAHTADTIRLRVEPRATARVVATLNGDLPVRVNDCAEGWCSVTVQGMTGYVLEKFLVRKTTRTPARKAGI